MLLDSEMVTVGHLVPVTIGEPSFLIEDEGSTWDDVKEKLVKVRSLLQSSTKTESSITLLLSSKESNKRKSNIKCNPLTVQKKKKN